MHMKMLGIWEGLSVIRVVGKSDKHIHELCCYNCSSKLEYVLADVKRGSHTDYTGCTESYKYIECPVCRFELRVKGY